MEKIEAVEQAHGDARYGEAWRVVNEITGRKKAKEGQVNGASPTERVENWHKHFKKLLGSPPVVEEPDEEIQEVFSDLGIEDGPFTPKEYTKVKQKLKLGKAAGPDTIPPEVFKLCEFDDIALHMCNRALLENEKPEMWSLMNIVPVPKSGDLSSTDNYRGISLICIIAKMYNRMILNRIRDVLDLKLRPNQNGFRKKRTTVGQILALRRIIEGVKANNLAAVLVFIDFKKAFDTIHRGKMMKILKAYGIPPNILRAIEAMYSGTSAKVLTPDGETETFEITAGVLQGDTLAPYLFVIVLDYALRMALADGKEEELGFLIKPRRSPRNPKLVLSDLDFADDISLLSNEIAQAEELLHRVEYQCSKVGLGLNAPKTKYLAYNTPEPTTLKTRGGVELERKQDFKYLGSWVDKTEEDVKRRKALAWQALNGMHRVWDSKLSKELKTRFFQATVESILLYGCESWSLTVQLEKSLDGTYTRMLRTVFGVRWESHTTNAELYGSIPLVSSKIASRRMQLAGHCYRHPELCASNLILWQPTHGRKDQRRPKQDYIATLKSDTGAACTTELGALMSDRAVWRGHVSARLRTHK